MINMILLLATAYLHWNLQSYDVDPSTYSYAWLYRAESAQTSASDTVIGSGDTETLTWGDGVVGVDNAENYYYYVAIGTGSSSEVNALLWSSVVSYSDIKAAFTTTFDAASYTAYSPTSFTIPEPTGGILILLGGALLALKRKNVRT